MSELSPELLPIEYIEKSILRIRNRKVILDEDLAKLYCTETRVLVQAVKRHVKRFPSDFMFQLSVNEYNQLKSKEGEQKGREGDESLHLLLLSRELLWLVLS